MPELEFEQKYVLDARRETEIINSLNQLNCKIRVIRQFYQNGDRYRRIDAMNFKENKKSLKLNTPYSVCLEEDQKPIDASEFWSKWAIAKRRLYKVRYEVASDLDQKLVVDFFKRPGNLKPYAIIAEVEVMLTETTQVLYLDLQLPIYLKEFLLKTLDARDESSKPFKNTIMIESNIEAVKQALEQLYVENPL